MSDYTDDEIAARVDYDTAACEASRTIVTALYGPLGDGELLDDDDYVAALKVLKALAEGGWLDPIRLSVVQIDEMLADEGPL